MNRPLSPVPNTSNEEVGEGEREVGLPLLVFLAFIVGLVAAAGAIVFKYLIAGIYNLSFYGLLSFELDPNVYGPPSPWGPFIILVPVIGGLIVVFLVKTFAPEAKGHGVPEVMFAIYHRDGNVRGIVAVIKSFASALSIGTGASVGREGPIIQIGASFGSTFGRWLGLIRSQKITLLAAGAGAGIAATFNTPLGGVLFAVEVLLPEISPRSFLPVVAATATSTYAYRHIIGAEAAFHLPAWASPAHADAVNFPEIGLAAFTGIALGLAAYAFVKVLEYSEDWFEALPVNDYFKNILGMSLVGLTGYLFMLTAGQYHVMSVGYATIQDILSGGHLPAVLLAALFVAKMLATTVSLGAGASGGIFSPSLFMGATLGAAIGTVGQWLFPEAGLSVAVFAMIGMGAMVGAATSASMTAIVMVFEMTRDYTIILPLVLAVALALGIRRALVMNDIYTIKLRKRGRAIPTDRTTNMFLVQPAREAMNDSFKVLPAEMSVTEALSHTDVDTNRVVVADGTRIVGYVRFATVPYHADRFVKQTLGEIMNTDFVIAVPTSTLNTVITRMSRRARSYAIVVANESGVPRAEDVAGVIDREEVAQAVIRNHYS
ncbi:chloride channel protein [Pseudohoeflea coraliihabitans]|uniref:Chloride channel protein n=1 Tax=Pseudohoeflea coraliihabitans TaxID=2860393 RepID=A0ABS6WLE5_9HYPH|nr:chloride channel protein [Pseudohoeflea sp. DP4N28-3]MBW3095894.1 chloride channel protein [Pseudohoeflea sp. DP4N28-3]